MSTGTTYKRLKRRFKKKLYNFLVRVNDIDFSRFRPVFYVLLIGAMLLALAKLPTPETDNSTSPQVACGTELALAIRNAVTDSDAHPADVVALFLSEQTTKDTSASLNEETLYSFYLTGKELSYLAEGAVTTASKETSVYLDGLNYTYHKNRLPFNRVTELSTASGTEIVDNLLYHIISTEDIFALFHYISYRSIGIMEIYPKDASGALLSDYQKVIFTETGTPLTIGAVSTSNKVLPAVTKSTPSVVTMQRGFNLVNLIKEPNKITLCICALFIALFALIWYIVPRMNRIRVWFRIYRIRSKKRSSHTLYGLRKRF